MTRNTINSRYPNPKREFLPQKENPLALDPVSTPIVQPDQIKRTQEMDHNHPHLDPSKAVTKGTVSTSKMPAIGILCSYFLPRQSLGPILKGWKTALSSLWNSAGAFASQRSGRNSVGRWKLAGERWAAQRFTVRLVWGGTVWPAIVAGSFVVVRKSMSGAGG